MFLQITFQYDPVKQVSLRVLKRVKCFLAAMQAGFARNNIAIMFKPFADLWYWPAIAQCVAGEVVADDLFLHTLALCLSHACSIGLINAAS